MEFFKSLFPEITCMKEIMNQDELVCWELYDEGGKLIGYAFIKDIPEAIENIPGMEEMDRYRVYGIIDPIDYKIIHVDITLHPEMKKEPWSEELVGENFEKKFIGLRCEEISLYPDGKIDAIADATLSSTWLTDGIRRKIEEIIKNTKRK
jgi:hypothetical protein